MPEYLAPGVFVEEVSFRAKSIEGVGTSVAAIAGPTRSGPIRGTPEVITSYAEFERIYGDPSDLTLGSASALNHTALAARAFFENGGKQLYVARVVAGGNASNSDGSGSTAGTASAASGAVTFKARSPGSGGNLTLQLSWADTQNLLRSQQVEAIPSGETVLLQVSGAALAAADFNGSGSGTGVTLPVKSLTALVTDNGGDYDFAGSAKVRVVDATDSAKVIASSALGSGVKAASVTGKATLTRVHAIDPASGALKDGTPAELHLAHTADVSDFTTGNRHWGNVRRIRGTLNAAGTVLSIPAAQNSGVSTDYDLRLSALAAAPGAAQSLTVQRSFNIDVLRDGEVIYSFSDIAVDPTESNKLSERMPAEPASRHQQLSQPVAASLASGATAATVLDALYALFDSTALNPDPTGFAEPQYRIKLTGGSDGDTPQAVDYAGETDEIKGSTGLAALEEVEDIAIVMTPAAAADTTNHQAVVSELEKHCNKMRYRVGLVDSRKDMALSEVRAWRSNFDNSRLALYYPWVAAADPTGKRQEVALPPAGFIAGIYARTDVDRGVHKAPANVTVSGALRFNQEINRFQQELLNPNGINCLRSFPGRGHRVWGARTLSSDPEWKYVNVRRYFLYLERSIEKGTQWAVFEPNGEALWANVSTTIEDFLFNEWRNGHLLGSDPKQAYFVRCDRSTMTQNDIDNGRLVCEIGVAPLRPAEFVVFRIGQKTADA